MTGAAHTAREEQPFGGVPIRKGRFLERPNRFVVRCAVDGQVCEAYLPNPGKLWELLLPGRTLYLVDATRNRTSRMPYCCVAVERGGRPVLLHTHWTNDVTAWLLDRKQIPGLEDARILRREVPVGRSRFDFLLDRGGRSVLMEVKSCTLFGRRIAMFPDAVTLRGRRHLLELGGLARQGTPGIVLFLVHWPRARFFLPDYHRDIDFARTFLALREELTFKAVALSWERGLTLERPPREAVIQWEILEREARDRGSYLLLLRLAGEKRITVGGLGPLTFREGYYCYVGSAAKNLDRRIERHLRKRKTLFWHIDYLRHHAASCLAVPVRSGDRLEHELATAMGRIADWSVREFGCSDCACETHLFGLKADPLRSPRFMTLLQQFRIDRLESGLTP